MQSDIELCKLAFIREHGDDRRLRDKKDKSDCIIFLAVVVENVQAKLFGKFCKLQILKG